MIDDLPPVRQMIDAFDLAAKKSLGQNFLLDLNITSKIARLAGVEDGVKVVEIGPGPGGLTRALLAQGAYLYAIERDERTIPLHQMISKTYPERATFIYDDALSVSLDDIVPAPYKIVANLPYNIGTELLTRWLSAPEWPPKWQSLTLMFQKEVAERIVAQPGSKAYGRLSILSQWRANAKIVYDLPPNAFTPPPKVSSAVVHIEPVPPKIDCDLNELSRVTKAAFSQRRKMIRASLKSLSNDAEARIEAAGIAPTARAEVLTLKDFEALVNAFKDA